MHVRSSELVSFVACLAGSIVLAVVTPASDAAAQDPIEEARTSFEAGTAAYDAGDHETALAHYRRAFGASPRAGIRFNIAICLEALGRYREAADEYEQAAASGELSDADTARARALAQTAREQLGTVEVAGDPVGAAVFVDEERLCALPCRLALDPGPHVLTASATDGRASAPTEIILQRGETRSVRLSVPAPRPVVRETPEHTRSEAPHAPEARGPSWLGWLGAGVAVLGGGATVALGLHTRSLESQYAELPTSSLRDEGVRAQILTNVALGVAVVGAVLALVDFVILAQQDAD